MNLKKTLITALIVLVILVLSFGIKLFSIYHSSKIPYRDILDTYNYIYTDIKHNDSVYTIVFEGGALYGNMRHYMYKDDFSQLRYVLLVDHALRRNKPILVNDSLNYILETQKVNMSLVKKYTNVDSIRNNCLESSGILKRNIPNSDWSAIIFVLLKNDITCSRDCESGYTWVIWKKEK